MLKQKNDVVVTVIVLSRTGKKRHIPATAKTPCAAERILLRTAMLGTHTYSSRMPVVIRKEIVTAQRLKQKGYSSTRQHQTTFLCILAKARVFF